MKRASKASSIPYPKGKKRDRRQHEGAGRGDHQRRGRHPAGIDANGNASQYLAALEENENAVYYNLSREVNYEVNQTITQIKEAQGQIEGLSVSVIINRTDIGSYATEVKRLVASAVGAKEENITVSGMAFGGMEAAKEEKSQAAEAAVAYTREKEAEERNAEMIRLIITAGAGFSS